MTAIISNNLRSLLPRRRIRRRLPREDGVLCKPVFPYFYSRGIHARFGMDAGYCVAVASQVGIVSDACAS